MPGALNLVSNSTIPQQVSCVNGLPPTPKVHMGACLMKVFNECPLKVHCAASWVHPDTHDQHVLLGKKFLILELLLNFVFEGCDEGIYCLNLNELHDATLDQLYPRKTSWLYVIKNVLMSISGKTSHVYRHDLVQLYSKKNFNFGLPSTMDSMINRIPEKLMPRKFMTATARVPDTKGCLRCCVGRNTFNGYKYLCGITSASIFLMQWYNPLNKFMLLKTFQHYFPPSKPLKLLEMFISPDMEYPLLCTDARSTGDPSSVDLSIINLNINSSSVWFDKDRTMETSSNSSGGQLFASTHYLEYSELDTDEFGDGTETMVPTRYNKNALNPVSIKQLEENLILIAHDGNEIFSHKTRTNFCFVLDSVKFADLNGKLKSNRTQPSDMEFDFRIDSIGKLPLQLINEI